MKASVYDRYGLTDVLRIEDLPKPSPAAGQVLVEVAATSVNLSDGETPRGSPLYSRIGGLRTPARRTLGSDLAGWVDAVGPAVTRFRPGDEVYGDNLAQKGVASPNTRSVLINEVIDYRSDDFTRRGPFDLILDLVAHRSVFAYRRALTPGGRYRCVGGSVGALLRVLTIGSLAGRLTHRRLGVLAVKEGPAHFAPIAELCAAGAIGIHIDRTFTRDEVPEALARVGEGHALGKVVVLMPAHRQPAL